MKQNRFKSYVLWTSVLSLVFLILTNLDVINIPSENIQQIINAILTILVGFGIINSPDNKGSL